MNKILFAAPSSGSGKTTVTIAVLAALKQRGRNVHAFKCGPDYIDPMFHRAALGMPCHNLDLYLTPEERVKKLFDRYSAGADTVVVEGVMGYYDGVGMTPEASAWHVADTLLLPVVLVVRPAETPEETVALVRGLLTVPENAPGTCRDHHLCALLLSDCSEEEAGVLRPLLEAKTGLPVCGYLPHLAEVTLESRHLGLVAAEEDPALQAKLDLLAKTAEETIDLDALLAPGETGDRSDAGSKPAPESASATPAGSMPGRPRIAVADDEAFRFCYDETLDAFRDAGADLVFFSPLRDEHLPVDIHGLYLPGGYPELHAETLAANETLKAELAEAVRGGLPTIAECGGFLYLGAALQTPERTSFQMAGVLPGTAAKGDRPVRFGYAELTSDEDTLIAPAGIGVRIHNFHYYDTPDRGETYTAVKSVSGRTYTTGFGTETLYAGFPHLYFAGDPDLAARFVKAAENYKTNKEH